MVQTPLPVDPHVERIVEHVRSQRWAVVVAPPGTGKTTRIPPALTAVGRTILLQPRRVAARTLARRIAAEQDWTVGREVGWQIRFERRFSRDTSLLVATEGILTARLQSDPLLSDFQVVVLDEFHERSLAADIALALVREAARSRDDLAIVVMSATIDPEPVERYLTGEASGRHLFSIGASTHPVEIEHRPGQSVDQAIRDLLPRAKGDVLAFLPGVRDIEQTRAALAGVDALVLPLHGSLRVEEQERALAPATQRKVILATNVAETSLTVEGVTEVVDSGQEKVVRYEPETGIDHLVMERISLASARQRAGRAGRTAPGRATRLWDARDILRPQRDAEIHRADLASAALDLIAWGADPRTFAWFDAPQADRIDAAIELLTLLQAIECRQGASPRLTAAGKEIHRLPLHPRLARLIVSAPGSRRAVAIAAAIGEGVRLQRSPTTTSDAFALEELAPRPIIDELLAAAGTTGDPSRSDFFKRDKRPAATRAESSEERGLRQAIFSAWPDRVAVRREPHSPRLLLASGSGAILARESGVHDGEFMVALEISGTSGGEALVRMASIVERDWLTPTRRETEHALADGRVIAIERAWYGAILLHEQRVEADPDEAQRIVSAAAAAHVDQELARRLNFAKIDIDWTSLISGGQIPRDWAATLPHGIRAKLERLAPATLPLPSGRTTRVHYREDGSVSASVKLQELFGLAETPRIGPEQTPVTFELLAPNGRPVQVTRDLRNFWNSTYAEVRKELRARYPKHPWPEDPWTAKPTHRTRRR